MKPGALLRETNCRNQLKNSAMLQLLLLAAGVIYFFRALKVRRMTGDDMKGMTPGEFVNWKDFQLRSHYWFCATVWGVSVLSLIVFGSINPADQTQITVAVAVNVLLLLGGLAMHGWYHDKAKRVKQAVMARQGIGFTE